MKLSITLAGVKFRPKETKQYIDEVLQVGDQCALFRARDNAWDERAVEVHSSGVFMGFVPKAYNLALSQALDQATEAGTDFTYTCTCTDKSNILEPAFDIEFEAPWLVERDAPAPPARRLSAQDMDDEIPF